MQLRIIILVTKEIEETSGMQHSTSLFTHFSLLTLYGEITAPVETETIFITTLAS